MKESDNNRTSEKDAVSQIIYFTVSAISMFLLADTFFVCGEKEIPVRIYQLASYAPQAIFLLTVPFLNLMIFQERSQRGVKLVQYAATTVLFTGCLLYTLDQMVPQLTTLYGSVKCSSWCFPAAVYTSSIMGSLMEFGRGSTAVSTVV